MYRDLSKYHIVCFTRCFIVYVFIFSNEFIGQILVLDTIVEPDNVGFDVRGDVKIFDFGLARGKKQLRLRLSYNLFMS